MASYVSVMSCNGYVLALRRDGNLPLCTYDGDQVGDSGTAGVGMDAMFIQSSGNEGGSLEIYGSTGSTIWSSHRFGGTAGTRIQLAPTGLQIASRAQIAEPHRQMIAEEEQASGWSITTVWVTAMIFGLPARLCM
ncbi:hypothetical protein [Streptomyces sp. NPDC026092]|uniref:hypothetical protein n=1 Tax=Streptomyces sp. NPDC026092 TaxID=3154797 RepID=UPI0033C8F609